MALLDDRERRAAFVWLANVASLSDIPEVIGLLQDRYLQLTREKQLDPLQTGEPLLPPLTRMQC